MSTQTVLRNYLVAAVAMGVAAWLCFGSPKLKSPAGGAAKAPQGTTTRARPQLAVADVQPISASVASMTQGEQRREHEARAWTDDEDEGAPDEPSREQRDAARQALRPGKLWTDDCQRCAAEGCPTQGEACLADAACVTAAEAFASCLHPTLPVAAQNLPACLPLLEGGGAASRLLGECVTSQCAAMCF